MCDGAGSMQGLHVLGSMAEQSPRGVPVTRVETSRLSGLLNTAPSRPRVMGEHGSSPSRATSGRGVGGGSRGAGGEAASSRCGCLYDWASSIR